MWFESNINKLAKNLFYAAFGTPFQETWGILNINKIRSNTWQGEYFICGVWILGYKRFDCRNLILKNLLFGLKLKKCPKIHLVWTNPYLLSSDCIEQKDIVKNGSNFMRNKDDWGRL